MRSLLGHVILVMFSVFSLTPFSSSLPLLLTSLPYDEQALSPGVQAVTATPHINHPNHTKLLIPIIAASSGLGVILIILSLFFIFYLRRQKNELRRRSSCYGKRRVSEMEFNSLELATDNFEESNILGSGGFGCVYKGKIQGGLSVAIKMLTAPNRDAITEFQTEVDILSKIDHPNIITLLGYSVRDETRLLIYELMPFGSLDAQLHGPSRGSALTWNLRLKIALDTARGLEYLHEHCDPPVIHRDLKSSNILLDSNFNAKLSDFGLAVVDGPRNKNETKLSGTIGYVAPEYLLDGRDLANLVIHFLFLFIIYYLPLVLETGKLTDKSDVYAFGVVLLELLLGRKPLEKLQAPAQCQSIVTWAMPQLTDRTKLPQIVDPAIRNSMDLKHLYQVAAVAVLCVQSEPSYRPLITDILHSLVPLVPVELGGTLRDAKPSSD